MLCREEKQRALNDRIITNAPQNENQRIATPFFRSLLEGTHLPMRMFSVPDDRSGDETELACKLARKLDHTHDFSDFSDTYNQGDDHSTLGAAAANADGH
jgi:hypothetical protein